MDDASTGQILRKAHRHRIQSTDRQISGDMYAQSAPVVDGASRASSCESKAHKMSATIVNSFGARLMDGANILARRASTFRLLRMLAAMQLQRLCAPVTANCNNAHTATQDMDRLPE